MLFLNLSLIILKMSWKAVIVSLLLLNVVIVFSDKIYLLKVMGENYGINLTAWVNCYM